MIEILENGDVLVDLRELAKNPPPAVESLAPIL
jgi:hypothetical protein